MMKVMCPVATMGMSVVLSLLVLNPAKLDAQRVEVEVENLQSAAGFYFTPVWTGFHDGSFDLFDTGQSASAALTLLAEEGDASEVRNDFVGSGTDGLVVGPAGFADAPVFDPGEIASTVFDIGTNDRFFSFASMIIPSNDGFFANDNAQQYELFDENGNYNGPITIDIFGANLYDAGTELNNGLGAPFSALGGVSSDEDNPIGLHQGLGDFLNTDTAAGTTISILPGSASPIARITVRTVAVPEPSTFGVAFLLAIGGQLIRRRRL